MLNEPITRIASRSFTLRDANIDTDQIIPARFLTTTERGKLGEACFCDWRFNEDGSKTAHPLNGVDPDAASILVAGDNFGCGSSREHAPWALMDFGFQAVITSRAADIFKSNAAKNGLVVCEIDEASHAALLDRAGEEVEIDVIGQTVTAGNIRAEFKLEPFARTCLIEGVDPMGYILAQDEAITRFEEARAA
ncbi:3-isopropylmalate dehydratase small subunit [Marinicauda pacifica]|jgi:3-isopropylmalate/(R)-2-methylmalate dehydratase small subunit|uniref:3-isopropylmalate dehydratase n=1 Tax=Marinicauda pacifica TaxID=1133559 RepID=A0A4S2HB25_9PROT|nr:MULTISPECIES: 3-isopropylmalate dehydratase small subunit [Marinicauda]TGY92963.1 3-isopropylmalate dehydratase small subunit [Marinicauda pacifica]GGE41690.1 3-isopropylmalate dehydratase small subunit [Marinicauda pacifica]